VTGRWTLGAQSPVPSPSWKVYAQRYSALLVAVAENLPGDVVWWDFLEGRADKPLAPDDTDRLTQLLVDGRLRNDLGEIMSGSGSRQWLRARRTLPQGETTIGLSGSWGRDDLAAHLNLEVEEPPGASVWSYPDPTVASLVAAVLMAIDGSKAKIRERSLHRLLAKAKAPFDVGSHVYMSAPLDDPGKFPPGARQVPCGRGFLLIVPPGATDEDTIARMRWVAAAIGASD